MSLFYSNISPFSSFAIDLGPLYVERVFDYLLTKKGIKEVGRMTDVERWQHYLHYLKKKANTNRRNIYAVIQFYKGHFYQQLSAHSKDVEGAQHLREKALCYYQTYLELADRLDESKYYAQWQVGMLQNILQYPWLLTEDSLLKAAKIDALRGEPMKKIVEHYILTKDWINAYHYSTIAVDQFFNKNPMIRRRWYIDFAAYDWTVIMTHRFICYKFGYVKDKNTSNVTAIGQTISQPDRF